MRTPPPSAPEGAFEFHEYPSPPRGGGRSRNSDSSVPCPRGAFEFIDDVVNDDVADDDVDHVVDAEDVDDDFDDRYDVDDVVVDDDDDYVD